MKLLFVVSVLVCAGLTAAWGQDEKSGDEPGRGHRRSPEEVMKKLDKNNDGKISLEEWKALPRSQKDPARAEEMFKRMDANHDGFVTLDELKAHPFDQRHGGHGRGKHLEPSGSASVSASPSP
jgi:hypothetical protein